MLTKVFRRFMPRGMQLHDMSKEAQSEGQEALLAPTRRCPEVRLSMGVSFCADKGSGETAPPCP